MWRDSTDPARSPVALDWTPCRIGRGRDGGAQAHLRSERGRRDPHRRVERYGNRPRLHGPWRRRPEVQYPEKYGRHTSTRWRGSGLGGRGSRLGAESVLFAPAAPARTTTRVDHLRLATYAEWAAGIEEQFVAYATQQNSTQAHDVALCEKRLLLLEKDPAIRALVQAVRDAFPALGSARHTWLFPWG
jgi:hypothetical protein